MEKIKFSITLDKDLKQKLEEDGACEERSLIGTITKACKFYLENKDKLILELSDVNISTGSVQPMLVPIQAPTQETQQEPKQESQQEEASFIEVGDSFSIDFESE